MPTLTTAPSPTPDSRPPTPAQGPRLTLLTVCLGYFVANWAMAPAASILPTIARDLDLSVPAAGWVMGAYFLMLVGTVLVMGRLGDLFGHARVFTLGALLFAAGQTTCGLAASYPPLLVGRGVQGVGSAMLLGTSLAIVAAAIPQSMRGRAVGMLTMAAAGSSLIGVWLATWSVEHLSWHWGFLFPTPVVLLTAILGSRLRLPAVQLASRRMDWAGAGLLFATIASAMLGLNHLHDGPETFESGATYHVGMHLLAVALFVAFVKVEQRAESPLLGFRLLRNVHFSSAITGNGIAHTGMLATTFLLPFLLERGRGLGPADTRLVLVAQLLAMVSLSLIGGYLYDRSRSPFWAIGFMLGIVGGVFAYALVGGDLPFAALVGVATWLGGALGGFTTVNNTQIMALAPQDQRGFAAGLVETTRQFGHTVGVSLSSSFMGAALAGAAAPSLGQYVEGFEQAALTMALLALLGLAALLWPNVRQMVARSGARSGLARPRPVAGGSD